MARTRTTATARPATPATPLLAAIADPAGSGDELAAPARPDAADDADGSDRAHDRPAGRSDDGPDGAHRSPIGAAPAAPVLAAEPDAHAHPGAPTFEDLYRDEYDGMVRVAYLLVGTLETAEELVQDAFIRVHLRWERLDAPGAFLRTCVVNACRDRIRRRVRLRARMPRLTADAASRAAEVEGGGAGPAAELHDVLLQLPMRQRTAVVGRFFCGWDDATIAAVLGVRPTTVRSLVHRGLATLRTEIPR